MLSLVLVMMIPTLSLADAGTSVPVTETYVEGNSWRLLDVIDGDTFKIHVGKGLPGSLSRLLIRIKGVDTPERGAKSECLAEQRLAEDATRFTEAFLRNGVIRIENTRWDKYGGRVLADVYVDDKLLSIQLITAKLARPYNGKKRQSWCFGL